MAALFAILIASIAARAPSVQLPIKRNNLPKVSDYSRVLNGQPFSMKYNNPKEFQQTYILFVAADKINQTSHRLKSGVEDENGDIMAEMLYKITPTTFSILNYADDAVPETEATIIREENKLTFQENDGNHVAGIYWSIIKTTKKSVKSSGEEVEDISWAHDGATAVRIIEQCQIIAEWKNPIEFEKFGWHPNSNGELEFNPVGFRPTDLFASCEFKSDPQVELSWDTEEIGQRGLSQIEARVPAENIQLDDIITCSMPRDTMKFSEDHCYGYTTNTRKISSPPSQLQYSENVGASAKKQVWTYVNGSSEHQHVNIECPLIDQAEVVQVISSDGWKSPIMNQVSNQLPEGHDESAQADDGFSFDLTRKGYAIKLHMNEHETTTEFRCEYRREQNGPLVGYSSPHMVVKYEEATNDVTVVPQWGLGIDSTSPVIQETTKTVNVATCYQRTQGKPAPIALKIKTEKSEEYFPKEFTKQHYISFSIAIPSRFDKAEVSCAYKNAEGEIHEVVLGEIDVIYKPKNLVVTKKGSGVTCTADVSSQDTVHATLSLSPSHKVLMEEGVAKFNLTADYTSAEIGVGEAYGVTCHLHSERFPSDDFSSETLGGDKLGEDGSSDADAHLAGPLALCLISACAVLLICFKMPPNKKVEHAKYTVAATEEPAETEDLEDPLSEDKPEDKPLSV